MFTVKIPIFIYVSIFAILRNVQTFTSTLYNPTLNKIRLIRASSSDHCASLIIDINNKNSLLHLLIHDDWLKLNALLLSQCKSNDSFEILHYNNSQEKTLYNRLKTDLIAIYFAMNIYFTDQQNTDLFY